jgi:hypothetical protein
MLKNEQALVNVIIPCLDDVMMMVEFNIFRPLPHVNKETLDIRDTGIV